MNRRFFLLAAPAIVLAPSLMRVSTLPAELMGLGPVTAPAGATTYSMYSDPRVKGSWDFDAAEAIIRRYYASPYALTDKIVDLYDT